MSTSLTGYGRVTTTGDDNGCICRKVQLIAPMDAFLSKYLSKRIFARPIESYLARPFARQARHRLLIFYHPADISFVQVYPFLAWHRELAESFGTSIRLVPVSRFLDGALPLCDEADTILVGPWFTVEPALLERRLATLRQRRPDAVIGFLDSYAANDLRLAKIVDPHIDWYLKKSLFRDRESYFTPFRGDTNLTEYYGDLYGIAADPVDWGVPRSILVKLRLSPNFLTAPQFLSYFPPRACPPQTGRDLDLQTRLGKKGTPWYSAMRNASIAKAEAIPGITRSPADRVDYRAYMDEMRGARLCFSPFGYGELCWRDVEAFQTGSVLIKPDMSHLETLPDLYLPKETYLPVKWDFSDLAEVVRQALADEGLRQRITQNAYARCADYLTGRPFVNDMRFLFESRPA